MKKTLHLACVIALLNFGCSKLSPGSTTSTEIKNLGDNVTKISVSSASALVLDDDIPVGKVHITANDNMHTYIVMKQDANSASFYIDQDTDSAGEYIFTVKVNSRFINNISASGGSLVRVIDPETVSDYTLNLSGGSHFEGEINSIRTNITLSEGSSMEGQIISNESTFNISGNSVAIIKGATGDLSIEECSGNSSMDCLDFSAENLDASVTNSSRIAMNVSKTMKLAARGASTINFKGHADIVNDDISGDSYLNKLD